MGYKGRGNGISLEGIGLFSHCVFSVCVLVLYVWIFLDSLSFRHCRRLCVRYWATRRIFFGEYFFWLSLCVCAWMNNGRLSFWVHGGSWDLVWAPFVFIRLECPGFLVWGTVFLDCNDDSWYFLGMNSVNSLMQIVIKETWSLNVLKTFEIRTA